MTTKHSTTGGGHYRARHPRGGPAIYFASSPSCWRAHLNAAAMLKRVARTLKGGAA
jgi:hypothetical protein